MQTICTFFKHPNLYISAVSEITIKTGGDGTDADIVAKICDGAGEADRNYLPNHSSSGCVEL